MSGNINQFIQLIRTALSQQNNQIRSEAENNIIRYRDSNTSQFFVNCSIIINCQDYDPFARQSAGTVASRLLNMKNTNNGKFFYDELYKQQKEAIKNNILNSLICQNPNIMRSAAAIIAVIAAIQLPRGQWSDIIDLMAQNCNNADKNIKLAALTTLGFICEQIKKSGQRINDRLSQQILGSIVIGIRQNNEQEIIQTSFKALQNSLSFLENLMVDEKYRNTVFQLFINNFKNGAQLDITYHAFFEFVKVSSPYLMEYRKALIDLTQVHLDRRDDISMLNLQMWEIIGSDYSDKLSKLKDRIGQDMKGQTNFMQNVYDQLLPHIMKCLLIMNKDQIDNEDLRLSAVRALQSFTKVCDKRVVEKITASVGTIINSTDPYHQQATISLFSSICEYPDHQYTNQLFANGFDHLFNLLQNSNQIVVKNSLIGFVRLAESLPQVFLLHRNVSDIFNTLLGFIKVEDFPQIRFIAVQILANISEGLKQYPQPVSDDPNILLTKIVQYYAQNLIKIHKQQSEVNEKITAIIMNIVMNTNKRDIITQLIDFMIQEYNKVLAINNNSIENKSFLIQQILSVLHTAILAHKNAVPNNELLGRICNLINTQIKNFGTEPQGLSLLGAVATTFNKSFEARASNYWDYINQGLNMVNQIATFKATLACIGDFARMMQSGFFNHASSVMDKLLDCINSSYDRELKLCIISCMGDLVLSIQDYAQHYLDSIIQMSDICFQAVYQLTNTQKDSDYIDELKANMIQMYSCVVFAINGKNTNKKLFDHFGNLATFIVRTCDKNVHPTVQYLKNCLYLLHDSAAFYWNVPAFHDTVKQVILSNEVGQLSILMSKFNNRPQIKELLDFIHTRRNM